MARQCALVGLPRSTYYYHTQGESAENLTLMRLLDKQYTDTPYYGIRRMTAWLRSQGYAVNHKRVARLLRTMGLETIYPKPRMSEPHPAHRVYPYLLRGVPITRVNQVWSTDITYIRLQGGFLYVVAGLDHGVGHFRPLSITRQRHLVAYHGMAMSHASLWQVCRQFLSPQLIVFPLLINAFLFQ